MLRLLHLSDIHFRGYKPPWDEDDDQRQEMVRDVERLVGEGGPVDGILIGGDIAFSGQPEEYEKAAEWLHRLIEVARCPQSAVWMVPGNHDVDRSVVEASEIIGTFYDAMTGCPTEQVSETLRRKLYGDPASAGLVAHLRAYNDFARVPGCAVSATKPHWEDILNLDGHPLLVWGVNSVLCSSKADCGEPWGDPTLFLGRQQACIPRARGKVRLAICHHPPGWLRDWADVERYVNRAHVALFGHMHSAAVEQVEDGAPLRVHAGAVGPDQGPDWLPTYNLLTLSLPSENRLEVFIQPRVWDSDDTCFVAADPSSDERFVDLSSQPSTQPPEPDPGDEISPSLATPLLAVPVAADPVSEDPAKRRDLGFRYLTLPLTRRLEIAEHLDVLEGIDVGAGDPFPEILRRIRDRDLIPRFAEALDR